MGSRARSRQGRGTEGRTGGGGGVGSRERRSDLAGGNSLLSTETPGAGTWGGGGEEDFQTDLGNPEYSLVVSFTTAF